MRFILLTAGVTLVIFLGLLIDAQSRTPVSRPAEQSEPEAISASGRIEGATPEIELRPRLSGRIVGLAVQEGQIVRKGTVLLRLDDQQYRHEVALAQAQLRLAQTQLERRQNGARSQERAEAAAMYQAKLAELERAELSWQRVVVCVTTCLSQTREPIFLGPDQSSGFTQFVLLDRLQVRLS